MRASICLRIEDRVDELGAVAGADEERLDVREEEAIGLQLGPALSSLGVDPPDPLGGDGDVVDVGLRAGKASVVEDGDSLVGEGVEPGPEAFLADRALLQRLGALPLVGERHAEAAEPTPFLAQPPLVLGLAAPVFASSRGSGNPGG
ncbi:hypothetical protein RBS12_00265 [Sinomonas sp. ASV322]|nr:hypothetical protein [Sinomonas sp. ASV322]MDQ4500741.1 hypothetical protein [Sinomonas sp. ASV322]